MGASVNQIIHAVKDSSRRGKFSWAYVEGILKRLVAEKVEPKEEELYPIYDPTGEEVIVEVPDSRWKELILTCQPEITIVWRGEKRTVQSADKLERFYEILDKLGLVLKKNPPPKPGGPPTIRDIFRARQQEVQSLSTADDIKGKEEGDDDDHV
jgi:hypothetical protein